ncbi:MAG: long-chain fatty acid--CoA ligase [Gammaproteobacteria bacterium]|nr:long-chain fatty acid--CoA ligase [Gammaproteobacteria bacterium]
MNLADWVDRHAGFTPEKAALCFQEKTLSYAKLAKQVALLADVLCNNLGLVKGDRVAFVGYNSPEMLTLLLACARSGVIFLPLNWRLAPAEHCFILDDCSPKAFFVGAEFTSQVESHRDQIKCPNLVSYGETRAEWHNYSELFTGAREMTGRQSDVGYDAAVLLCYTSGTTGQPKGVLLDQNALLYTAINSVHMHDMTSSDRILSTLPMFHVGGLNIQTLAALHTGATIYLHAGFDPVDVLHDLEEQAINLAVLVPAQLLALLDLPSWQQADFASLRSITTGSTLIPKSLIETICQRGVPLIQVYGSTETAPIAAYLKAEDAAQHIGSTGKAALHCDIRLVDAENQDVDQGCSGEILVQGPNVMISYWNAPDETAATLKNGWFHTGDSGYMDPDGYLYVDGRIKDMIISGSENIYPGELENLLLEHQSITEAAVVGRPDERWGEVPVAVVVSSDATLDAADVTALFENRLGRFKHPRDVVFVDSLPRNAMGKIQKHEIMKMVEEVQQ